MVLITNSRRVWVAGMAVSLAIFAVLYLTVIKPSSDTANQAVKSGLQQSEQVIRQAQKGLGATAGQTGTAAGTGGQASAVAGQAAQQLSNAAKLTSCVAAAGTDVSQVQTCQTKYAK